MLEACVNQKIENITIDSKTHKTELADFCKKISQQKDCPPEYIDIVNKEFWNLI